jgi:type IV secretory pathway VirB10-like protein
MTVSAPSERDEPRPKAPMPPLDSRAPRPSVVRLRRGVVVGVVMAGAGLVAGSLAWAFVVQPELRSRAHDARLQDQPGEVRGAVRPSEKVTDGPATYADLDRLPEPRRLGAPTASVPDRAAPQPPAPAAHRPRGGLTDDARSSGLFFAGGGSRGPTPAGAPAADDAGRGDYGAVYNTHALLPPLSPYEVKAGAVVAAALLTAVDTSRPGPVTATVTENVFDTVTGRRLLIPQGARLVGRHEGESRYGDRRAFIVWERLILPNGKSLVLPKEPGVDAQGAIGARGDVDRRLFPLAIATVFAGAITGLGQVARDHDHRSGGFLGDAGDAAAIEAAQVGGKLIDRELEVRPVVRLPAGARVRVFITKDLILEPYQP